jgi:hypothetical protein
MKVDAIFAPSAGPQIMWRLWAGAALVVTLLHLSTATLSPVAWQDEVQILDWGRGFMPGADQGAAMSWLYEGRTYRMICYLGCVLQETAYRLAGGEMFGPRASSILGAALASFALLGWLLARGTVPWIALACSLLLLCDPAFTLGYRGARVDSWSIAFMLLACWAGVCGRRQGAAAGDGRWKMEDGGGESVGQATSDLLSPISYLRSLGWFVVAGICAAIAGVIWVSAILLLPLLVHELGGRGARGEGREARGDKKQEAGGRRQGTGATRQTAGALNRSAAGSSLWGLFFGAVVTGLAALISVGLLFLPVWSLLPEMVGDFSARGGGQISRLLEGASWQKLWRSLLDNPLLVPLALLAFFLVRQWTLLAAFLLAAALTLYTGAYVHRAVYLLPYLLVGIASGGTTLWSKKDDVRWMRPVIGLVLLLMLAWSAGISVAGRNFVAWRERTVRDPALVLEWARHTIGPGPAKVYLWTWDWYYAGRKLGWSLHKSFAWENMGDERFTDLLSRMDWLVVAEKDPHRPDDDELADLGFTQRFVQPESASESGGLRRKGYGSYLIYARDVSP